jgi:methionyl-tRNA formyltransferase
MKIVFVGASRFGLRCLDLITQLDGFEVTGVVTAPKKFVISYRPEGVTNVLHADIETFCCINKLLYKVCQDGIKDDQLFEQVKAWQPDLFVVAGWYYMIPKRWRRLAPAYGLHASLLPDYSGGAPLVWAMINGEKYTGVTLFQFDDGVDSGPIVGQRTTTIEEADTIATLYARIEELGLELLQQYLPLLANGTTILTPQDHSKRRIFPQRSPEDGKIKWEQPAHTLYNFIRAQTRPYPGAFTIWKGMPITIWQARVANCADLHSYQVGELALDTHGMFVKTGAGLLEIIEARFDDKTVNGEELRRIVGGAQCLGV